jgi:hypothetical protein
MPLNKPGLKNEIKAMFDNAKSQNWNTDQLATALAEAIDRFVRSADVKGVTVDVKDSASNPLGTGTQTGAGTLE